MKSYIFSSLFTIIYFCSFSQTDTNQDYIQVLGIIQDAGLPHIGCEKDCCLVTNDEEYFVSSIGLVDKKNSRRYLFDATPDMSSQLRLLEYFPKNNNIVDGVFLTHAHIGHYTGLMYFGREGIGASDVKVYANERMSEFLEDNGPWDQLVRLKNISIEKLYKQDTLSLSQNLKVIPVLVPHRDEYSETVGYKILGKIKSLLFIPDIDKWSEWNKDIVSEVKMVDFALIDGTFYNGEEIDRDMDEIPHPSVEETIDLFSTQPLEERKKIYFIHLNHTNPLLNKKGSIKKDIENMGFNVAEKGLKFFLD